MVKNIWSKIKLVCGNHGDDVSIEMAPHEGADGLDMFYSCPKYYPMNRAADERPCGNRINLIEYQAAVEHVSDVLEENTAIDLTGHKWSNKKGITFEIIKFSKEYIIIKCLNTRALRH